MTVLLPVKYVPVIIMNQDSSNQKSGQFYKLSVH